MTEPVPTAAELAHVGLATYVPGNKGTVGYYRVSDEGHRRMGDAMRRNAEEATRERNLGTSPRSTD